ncbi:TIGR03643, TIGR03643 family protein [Candidatus Pelagibacterales bacterium]|jgi:uncharacterized protein (TIGR03643 family)|nr:TIGR03643 family protein [Candidatus Fonsibacter sp.]MCF8523502.1 TIGR03643 family protein [Candidatus Fonsibacter sp.]
MKKGLRPITRTANPEPQDKNSISWIIWAAWADRITFEDIKEQTGKSESEVIKIMRKNLSESSFKLWRKRTHNQSIKHRKKFENSRKQLNQRIYFSDDD